MTHETSRRLPEETPISVGRVFAAVVFLGMAWMLLELVIAAVTSRDKDLASLFDRFLGFLPWQTVLFIGLGALVAGLAVSKRFSRATLGWIAVWLASSVFGAARVGEGVLRRGEAGINSLPMVSSPPQRP